MNLNDINIQFSDLSGGQNLVEIAELAYSNDVRHIGKVVYPRKSKTRL